ncbi:MAG: hypothetical protein COA67_07360 [Lutibacter sp.]|nr:MAG: hypothetical protein COA67_07360 [Lutibacter sp.]
MANIVEKNETKNMQTHIEDAYAYLDDHLPPFYGARVKEKLKALGVTASIKRINNVRNQHAKNTTILNALLAVAKEEKAQVEALKKFNTKI